MPFHVAQELDTMEGDEETRKLKVLRAFLMADIHARKVGITSSGAAVALCLVKVGWLLVVGCVLIEEKEEKETRRFLHYQRLIQPDLTASCLVCSPRGLANTFVASSCTAHYGQCRRFTSRCRSASHRRRNAKSLRGTIDGGSSALRLIRGKMHDVGWDTQVPFLFFRCSTVWFL